MRNPALLCCVSVPAEECDKIPDDMEGLVSSFDRLQRSLQQAQDYVSAVVVRCLQLLTAAPGPEGVSDRGGKPWRMCARRCG